MKLERQIIAILIIAFLGVSQATYGQNKIALDLVASGFSIPVDLAFDHNNTLYVIEKQGRIIRIKDGVKQNFLDITDRVNSAANERGLLGLAFHPDYIHNGYFYVNYSGANGETTIARFRRSETDSTIGDVSSEKIILTVDQPYNNHNGGDLNFGHDGYLYIGMGDGGSGGDPGNRSQNPLNRLGKMLRIDINTEENNYLIPADNPFVMRSDTLPEIWSLGLRNPWRFSFDQKNGDLWIADVGQNKWEELDFEAAGSKGGRNYGWRCFEGLVKYDFSQCDEDDEVVPPIHVYANNSAGEGCSITGGYVYRGNELPYLNGYYVYGDFCSGKIWRLKKTECDEVINEKIYQHTTNSISTFGQDLYGEMYMASMGDGKIYKLGSSCALTAVIDTVYAPSCLEAQDGSVLFTISGADSYTINIDGASSPSNLAAGTYNYTITQDANVCIQKGCFTIPQGSNQANCQIHATFLLCKSGNFVFDGEGCEGLAFDSLVLLKDKIPYQTYKQLYFILNEPGVYAMKYYRGPCTYFVDSMFLVSVDTINEKVEVAYDGANVIASGNFSHYYMYKNGFLAAENDHGIFEIHPDSLGTYVFYGININGCLSPGSEPLIISSITDHQQSSIRISPNPANDLINLQGDGIQEVTLFAGNGRKLYHNNQNLHSIDVSTFPSGAYILQVRQNNTVLGFKVEILK